MTNRTFALLAICLSTFALSPQKTTAQRLSDNNTIGWYNTYNTINLGKGFSVWLEYSWRRDNIITHWQQSLARGGLQYRFKNNITMTLLYGYIITYPYGDYPAGPYTLPENRLTEQLSWSETKGRYHFSHRIRLEQRWLGKIDQKAPERDITGWNYLNRLRYMGRVNIPLNRKTMEDKTLYAGIFDEIFIGFGKNVGQNIYDQNRVCLLAGYKFNKMLMIEAGYLNQIVQQGSLVRGRPVFQYNNGPVVNAVLNLP
ncbi:MAG: DUF2490 domain-containing protein [Flavipsychrobacter sp.]|nr:DUF2490 domain-containing protein [Flavipsychrobacter sp.]